MNFESPRRAFGTQSLAAMFLAVMAPASFAYGGDWPQILGPDRNGVTIDEKVTDKFPRGGPPTVWTKAVGEGFAGVAVVGETVILFHRIDDEERVEALNSASGEPRWSTSFPAPYGGGVSADRGPRCVPLIHNDRVFLLGAAGNLHCVALSNGEKLWSRALAKEYQAAEGYFGFGSTPIVEGDKLLVNVGGRAGAGIVAFAIADGKPAWKATDEQASYSSPVGVTLDGVRHVVFVTRLNALSIDPEKGAVRWKFPFGARGPTVNAASPLVFDRELFLSASYGVGAVFATFGKDRAETVWENNDTMSSQYSTCVRHDGFLYGVDGRQDVGSARLRCFEPKTGKVHWTKERFGVATLIVAGDKLIIVKDDGTLLLVAANPKEYQELGQARLFRTTTRPLPALSRGFLYVRDTETLKCVDLRPN